jgi:hypothetical protein
MSVISGDRRDGFARALSSIVLPVRGATMRPRWSLPIGAMRSRREGGSASRAGSLCGQSGVRLSKRIFRADVGVLKLTASTLISAK